ncbi:MAG TPA: hypothetical protein VGC72_09805 [Candidatus Elarobacter sp.]
MIRSLFLTTLGSAGVAAATLPVPGDGVPAVLDGGRFFATPHTTGGLRTKWWLDTDGGGFVFSEAARRLALPADGPRAVRAPRFADKSMPPADGVRLPVLDSAQAKADPLLQGFDGQLGASWFIRRRWLFDYPAATLRCNAASRSTSWFPIELAGGLYPRIRIDVGGTVVDASLDSAASVAVQPDAAGRFRDSLPAIRATSFVKRSLFDRWQTEHPDWTVLRNVGVAGSIDAIRAANVAIGRWPLGPQWFTTRPNDDVFEGETISLKLGASAFDRSVLELDYPQRRVGVIASARF